MAKSRINTLKLDFREVCCYYAYVVVEKEPRVPSFARNKHCSTVVFDESVRKVVKVNFQAVYITQAQK